MKQFVTLLIILICTLSSAKAQNFLKDLQKNIPGEGSVTIHQSANIDELVNGKNFAPKAIQPNQKQQADKVRIYKKTGTEKEPEKAKKESTEKTHDTIRHEVSKPKTTEPKRKEEVSTSESSETDFDIDIPTIDLRKKVMRKSYKAMGFRVQVFAGGNSRSDRQKAQNIGNDIKMNYPDQPIYVHFYSPRWICRVGNYRSYEEAHRMLLNVKRLGYKQACIVKGKISIQY